MSKPTADPRGKVALVYGATGVSGWALMKNLLSFPTPTTFRRVIGIMRSPLSKDKAGLPHDDRLELCHGIDLSKGADAVKEALKANVPNVHEVTHVYYVAWTNANQGAIYTGDMGAVRMMNANMTRAAVTAIDALAPGMEFWVQQSGGNHYGLALTHHFDKFEINCPLLESQPRLPEPMASEIYYYPQIDAVTEVNAGKSWGWCECRPDVIVGFVPYSSSMTTVEPVAIFLSTWRHVYGRGAKVPFPGHADSWKNTFTDVSQEILSKSEIFCSLSLGSKAGEAFNVGDSEKLQVWSSKWPKLAAWFGLEGVGPVESGKHWWPEWWAENKERYEEMRQKYGLKGESLNEEQFGFLYAVFHLLGKDRVWSLKKIRGLGFKEELPEEGGWYLALERMANAKVIPKREKML